MARFKLQEFTDAQIAQLDKDLSGFDVIFIDSVNEMNFTREDITNLQNRYPQLSIVGKSNKNR